MLVVAVSGGIGAGKSAFAAMLRERGARVIDADELARAALEPGEEGWRGVVEHFGEEILEAASMRVDRKRLAQLVFNDPNKLAALNAVVHPMIMKGIADELERARDDDVDIVVIDAALVIETGLVDVVNVLVVVDAPEERRAERLVRERGMAPSDVSARMRSQVDIEELLRRAALVVGNHGDLDDLEREADRVWEELKRMAA